LRDVTGTVEAIPLIASSIMSKKIAEGAEALVLDVKVGSGAFMKSLEQARDLASALVSIGVDHGLKISALLTDMSVPLGRAVGNAVEVAESVEVLRGGGPSDVIELTVALATEMLSRAGISADPAAVLASGEAYETWARMIRAQGGDPDAPLPVGRHKHVVTAPDDGYLTTLDAYAVGVAAWRLGAGRARKEDPVQAGAGILCLAKPGDRVTRDQPLLELHTDTPDTIPAALNTLTNAYRVGETPPPPTPLILDTIRG
jgi:thymidine phosphorylase